MVGGAGYQDRDTVSTCPVHEKNVDKELVKVVIRRYPFGSIWKEFDEMMAEMEKRFTDIMEGLETERFLPAPGFHQRMLPALRGEFSVDIREHEDEVVVIADLPGVNKEDITLTLVDPRNLEIASVRQVEKEETEKGYHVRERLRGAMKRRIILPTDVTEDDAKASFTNGVLELHLKKIKILPERRIPIE